MGAKALKQICHVNRSLITLKFILFVFYGALGCLYASLTPHMISVGLKFEESRLILIVVPLVSCLGPLIVGPLADRIADKKKLFYGNYLKILIAVCVLLAALFYALLLTVPRVTRSEGRRPKVNFGCDADGAIIYQERCSDEKSCYHFGEAKFGSLILTSCSYTCQNPTTFEDLYNPWVKGISVATTSESSKERSEDYIDYDDERVTLPTISAELRQQEARSRVYVEPPHLCTVKRVQNGTEFINVVKECHVYTKDLKSLTIDGAVLRSATNQENDTHSAEWCNYPLDGFQCNIPAAQAEFMKNIKNSSSCVPMIECQVMDPYDSPRSIFAEIQCLKIDGDLDTTFWTYLILRAIADIFPTAAVTLLNTAVIIATRETSTGLGDVGRQIAFGSLGWAVLPYANYALYEGVAENLILPVVIFAVFMVIITIVLYFAKNMPVSPPEWWWHTKIGMLAIPMSAIRKYGPEIIALTVVTAVLGTLWSVIDSYQLWHFLELDSKTGRTVIAFTLTVAAIPAIFFLWNSETIVDYCGHSNILIAAFTIYILRFTGLVLIEMPLWALIIAALEPITLGLTWVTIILYMRHLMPRSLTATGQAIPVIAFFCIGKSIGAMLGYVGNGTTLESLQSLYISMAIVACVVAILYFLLYHCILLPRCAAKPQSLPSASELQRHAENGTGTINSNGSYTPLRVYHNAMGRKGQFRY